jgi:hypothetical protein
MPGRACGPGSRLSIDGRDKGVVGQVAGLVGLLVQSAIRMVVVDVPMAVGVAIALAR